MGVVGDITKVIKDHVAKARLANTHPAKLLALSSLLKNLFGVELEELVPGIEARLGSKLYGLRGSAALIFSNVVFEVKVDLKRELDDAMEKLKKYLQALYEREPERRSIGFIPPEELINDVSPWNEGAQQLSPIKIAVAPPRRNMT